MLNKNFNVLKLYCKRSPESFNIKVKASGLSTPLYIDCNALNDKLYIEINLPAASDTLELFVNKTDTIQKAFEFYGLLIETSEDKGVLYNSVGINGASLKSILKENLLLYQVTELKPDLVILDLGLNDFYKTAFNSREIEMNLCNIIDVIQSASPDAGIILCAGQDVYYRYWDEANCKLYSSLVREIASRKGCAFYDYYNVSGGQYSMLKWYYSKLAQYDKVHLTSAGYFLRGELFLNALLNSYYISLTKPEMKTFIASKEFPDTTKIKINLINKNIPEVKDTDAVASAIKEQTQVWKAEMFYYKVKQGDNLGAIAIKYGVTVKQLQFWNNLKNVNINTGKILVIYKQKLINADVYTQQPVVAPNKPITKTQNQTSSNVQTNIPKQTTIKREPVKTVSTKGKVKYSVKSGDNLWSISKKYGVPVDQIKKQNNLSSNALKQGMVLIISK
ncbi:MAG: LysM peptidoglycan-binding domain-containing protein [Bacteroidetes bacterium]|nr:LysM peptidoglycan-binding domain-containing protein [Bacteroidota bacterium]